MEKINNEFVLRIPANVDFKFLEQLVDYISVTTNLAKSMASDEEADKIADEIKSEWWEKNKELFRK